MRKICSNSQFWAYKRDSMTKFHFHWFVKGCYANSIFKELVLAESNLSHFLKIVCISFSRSSIITKMKLSKSVCRQQRTLWQQPVTHLQHQPKEKLLQSQKSAHAATWQAPLELSYMCDLSFSMKQCTQIDRSSQDQTPKLIKIKAWLSIDITRHRAYIHTSRLRFGE